MTLSKEQMQELSREIVAELEKSRTISNRQHSFEHEWVARKMDEEVQSILFWQKMRSTAVGTIIVAMVSGIIGFLALIGKRFIALIT
jgi:hypothetical protein